jgi:hypothetical protein
MAFKQEIHHIGSAHRAAGKRRKRGDRTRANITFAILLVAISVFVASALWMGSN